MSFLSTEFNWNNVSSEDMNIQLVRIGQDTITQSLSAPKTLVKEHVKFKNTFYYGADRETYTLSMQIMKTNEEEPFIPEDRRELLRFFMPDDEFHLFIVDEDFPDIEFWVQFTKVEFTINAIGRGYFQLECESNDPYPFSSMEVMEFDLSDNTTSTIIEIPNNCNTYKYFTPNILQFTLVGDSTSFSLKNLTNSGNIFSFTGLNLLETIAINSNQEIISDSGIERISKFNFGFNALELSYGINRLEITGKCILTFQLQYPIQI